MQMGQLALHSYSTQPHTRVHMYTHDYINYKGTFHVFKNIRFSPKSHVSQHLRTNTIVL